MSKFKKTFVAILAMGLTASQAMAAITAPTYDMANAELVGGGVLVGVAGFWLIRKVIGLAR